MLKQLFVNVDPQETRIAVLEDGKLMDFELERGDQVLGNIYLGRVVSVLPGMDAAFVDIGLPRNAFIYVSDVLPEAKEDDPFAEDLPEHYSCIKEALKVGEEILVQVVKPPVGSKGARVSARLSLSGRFIVLLVSGTDQVGVSHRIDDGHERSRLHHIAERIRPLDHGLIVRTEGEGKSEADLKRDVDLLEREWNDIVERSKQLAPPSVVYSDLEIASRVVRDYVTRDLDEVWMDDPSIHCRVIELLQITDSALTDRVHLYQDDVPLFDAYAVEPQLAGLLDHRVSLKCGGDITIDHTEALTAIDVNTGSFVGHKDMAATIVEANLEAIEEVARQLRLRDIGGIIVVDLIYMERLRDRTLVMNRLEKALARDRTRSNIANLSPLGIVEITRRRKGRALAEMLCDTCPYCTGLGFIRSSRTMCFEIVRRARRLCRSRRSEAVLLTAHPEVAAELLSDGVTVPMLEQQTQTQFWIRIDEHAHPNFADICPASLSQVEQERHGPRAGTLLRINLRTDSFPEANPVFVASGSCLIRLSEDIDPAREWTDVRITDAGRWFAEGRIES